MSLAGLRAVLNMDAAGPVTRPNSSQSPAQTNQSSGSSGSAGVSAAIGATVETSFRFSMTLSFPPRLDGLFFLDPRGSVVNCFLLMNSRDQTVAGAITLNLAVSRPGVNGMRLGG